MANKTVQKQVEVMVVGPSSLTFGGKVGDKLVVRLNTFPKDPTAIKLETTSGEEVGYIAAQKKTAMGYPLASEVFKHVSEGDTVVVSSVSPLLVNITEKDVPANGKVKRQLVALLSGHKHEYANRIKIVSDSRQAKAPIPLELSVVGDRIVLSYKGVPCGYASSEVVSAAERVLKANKLEVTPIEKIMEAISEAEKVEVSTNWIDAIVVPVIFEIEEDAKTAAVSTSPDYSEIMKSFEEADALEMQKRLDWLKSIKTKEYAIKCFMNKMDGRKGLAPFEPCYIPNGREVEYALSFSHGIGEHRGNLLLMGPAGSGKNKFILTIANLLDLQLIDKSCSAGVDEEGLFGYLSMKADGEKPSAEAVNLAFKRMLTSFGMSKLDDKAAFAALDVESQIAAIQEIVAKDDFDYSVLFDAMRGQTAEIRFEPSIITQALEYPSLINLDEVNMLRATVTASMHGALDTRRSVLVNGYKTVKAHSDVIFTATMNEGDEYAGTNEMNFAFEDRWHPIDFVAPEAIGPILKQEVPTLNAKAIKILDDLYKRMKALRGEQLQERSFSQRGFVNCAINIALGNDIKDAIMATIIPKIRDKDDRAAVMEIVDLKF